MKTKTTLLVLLFSIKPSLISAASAQAAMLNT